jgi:hypothetical protein
MHAESAVNFEHLCVACLLYLSFSLGIITRAARVVVQAFNDFWRRNLSFMKVSQSGERKKLSILREDRNESIFGFGWSSF